MPGEEAGAQGKPLTQEPKATSGKTGKGDPIAQQTKPAGPGDKPEGSAAAESAKAGGDEPGSKSGEKSGNPSNAQPTEGDRPGGDSSEPASKTGGSQSPGKAPGQGDSGSKPGSSQESSPKPGQGEAGKPGGQAGGEKPGQGRPDAGAQPGNTPGQGQPQAGGSPMPGQGAPKPGEAGKPGGNVGDAQPEFQPGERGPGQAGERRTDDSKPLPDASAEVPDRPAASPAPDIEQSPPQREAIRKLSELLEQDRVTPELEKRIGMTRDEMQQFVKKFEQKSPRAAAREGQEIKAGPGGPERKLDPNRKAPDLQPGLRASNRNQRGSNTGIEDKNSGLSEGNTTTAPPELRKRFEAYKSSLGRTRVNPPTVARPAAPAAN
ncbi:MAG: hypothetical protein SFX72_08215 [Isosphaeraceae bacterium]|nr:hypothetical protein [Isosphaeraceae bacterium]